MDLFSISIVLLKGGLVQGHMKLDWSRGEALQQRGALYYTTKCPLGGRGIRAAIFPTTRASDLCFFSQRIKLF